MKYNFDEVIDRRGTGSLKWDLNYKLKPVSSDMDINSLWLADMDFTCARPIIEAVEKRAAHPVYGYTYHDNMDLFQSVRAWNLKRYGWDVKNEDIFYAPGVVAAIVFLINGFTKEGDGIIIQPPVYYPFRGAILNNNRKIIKNPLLENPGGYEMDFTDLEKKAAVNEVSMMILCSPHNPVGRVWTESELKTVGDICKRNNVLLVSDEIHGDLVRKDNRFIPAAKAGEADNTITCSAPSKSFNIPGLMISSTIIHNDDFKSIWRHEAYSKTGMFLPNPFGAEALKAAYSEGEDWLDQAREYIEGNLKLIKAFVDNQMPGVEYEIPEGTYLAWMNFNGAGQHDDRVFADRLENKHGILVDPGSIFGTRGKGFIRLNAACPRTRLADAMHKIESTLKI